MAQWISYTTEVHVEPLSSYTTLRGYTERMLPSILPNFSGLASYRHFSPCDWCQVYTLFTNKGSLIHFLTSHACSDDRDNSTSVRVSCIPLGESLVQPCDGPKHSRFINILDLQLQLNHFKLTILFPKLPNFALN